jgi:hypothetical protein
MFQPKLRSLATTTALVSALALIPVHGLNAQPRSRPEPRHREVAVGTAPASLWSLLLNFFEKQSIRIDPNGNEQPEVTPAPSPAPEPQSGTLVRQGGF